MRKLMIGAALVLVVLVLAVTAILLFVDPDDYRDDIAERASQQLGREVALSGPMSLKIFPRLAIEISEVSVGNPADFGTAPELARVGVARASVQLWPLLSGQLEVGAVTLEDAALSVVTNATGRSNLEGLMAADSEQPRAEPDLSGLTLEALRLRNVELVTIDQRTQERGVVRIDSFELDAFQAGQASDFRLTATLGDGQVETLNLTEVSGAVEVSPNLSRLELQRLVAEFVLPEPGITGSLRGAAALDLTGEVPVATLPQLELMVMVDALRLGVTARAPVRVVLGDPVQASLDDIRLSLNGEELSGRGTARLGERLQAEFAVSGDRFDLRPLIQATGGDAAPSNDPAAPAEPPALEALEALDLRFDLALGALVVSDALTLSEVDAQARLQDARLVLMPLDARLLGGRFDGRVEVDFKASPPTVALQPRLSGVAVDQLAGLVTRVAPLRGLGDFDLDLSFSGLSAAEILRSIDGSGSFTVSEGALLGVDLKRLVSEELSTANLDNIRRSFGGSTEFERFGGRMEVRSGVVELPNLDLSASDYGLSGSGQIDLPANQVDYRVELALGETLNASLPRVVRQALGGRLPLTISGPIGEPTVMVDMAGMAERVLRQELQQRLLGPRQDDTGDEEPAPDAEPTGARADDEAGGTEGDESDNEPPPRERGRDRLLRTLLERSAHEEPSENAEPEPAANEPESESEAEPPPAG